MSRRGITITSVIVIIICSVVLFASLLVTMGGCGNSSNTANTKASNIADCITCGRRVSINATSCPHCGEPNPSTFQSNKINAEAMLSKDQALLKSIFSGISFWAPSHNGKYPIPGLEARLAGSTGQLIKGRGLEDMKQNDHASMLSMCIMQNLITPNMLISANEQSSTVNAMEYYNYDAYNPIPSASGWTLWDPNFVNDLANDCNNSYGIMPITGKRKQQNWGVSTHSPSSFIVIGTRGPADGIEDPYSKSNLMHGTQNRWKGAVVYGDGHTEILESFYPSGTTYVTASGGSISPDNIFLEETDQQIDSDYMPGDSVGRGQGADVILTHIKFGDVNTNGKGGGVNANGFLHD